MAVRKRYVWQMVGTGLRYWELPIGANSNKVRLTEAEITRLMQKVQKRSISWRFTGLTPTRAIKLAGRIFVSYHDVPGSYVPDDHVFWEEIARVAK